MTDKPDTSPQTVERFAQMLEKDASDQWTKPSEMTGLLPDDEYNIADTLRALASDRDRALEWRDHDRERALAAEARAEAAETAIQAALERLDASLFTNAEHQQAKDILKNALKPRQE